MDGTDEMELLREKVAVRRDLMIPMLDEVIDIIRTSPFGTRRKQADRVVEELLDLRVDLGNLLCEADDAYKWNEGTERWRRR